MYLHFYYLHSIHTTYSSNLHSEVPTLPTTSICQHHYYDSFILPRGPQIEICFGTILYSFSYMYFFLFNYSMRYDTASSTYTLQIKDVQRPDEGTYQCQIIVAINNKVTKSVDLTVAQPPVITDNSTRSVVVEVGNPVELICHALGSPPPSVSWRRQNHQILPTGGVQVPIYLLIPDN